MTWNIKQTNTSPPPPPPPQKKKEKKKAKKQTQQIRESEDSRVLGKGMVDGRTVCTILHGSSNHKFYDGESNLVVTATKTEKEKEREKGTPLPPPPPPPPPPSNQACIARK